MSPRKHYGLFLVGLIYLTAVSSQTASKVTPIAYKVIRSRDTSPKMVALINAQEYSEFIKKTDGDILIFPEYGLITMEVVEKSKDHLDDYSFTLPGIQTNLCDKPVVDTAPDNQKALREIGCAAQKYKKHVIFHVLEATSYYSTIIHVDKNGVMKNVYRKDVIVAETSVQAFKDKQDSNFNIDGTDYWISMGYDPFTKWKPEWKNIIHFSPVQLDLPFFSDLSPAVFHSKEDNSMVYSPTLNGCATEFNKFCPRQKAIVINKGIMNDPGFIEESKLYELPDTLIPLENNKAQNGECKVEIESSDAAKILQNYKLAYFETKKYVGRNIFVCALVSINNKTALDFQKIVISNKKSNLAVPVTLNENLSPIENYNWDNSDKVELSGDSLKRVVSFGIISENTIVDSNIASGSTSGASTPTKDNNGDNNKKNQTDTRKNEKGNDNTIIKHKDNNKKNQTDTRKNEKGNDNTIIKHKDNNKKNQTDTRKNEKGNDNTIIKHKTEKTGGNDETAKKSATTSKPKSGANPTTIFNVFSLVGGLLAVLYFK